MKENLTDYEKGYIEASIDTDGCVSIYKQKCKMFFERGWSFKIRVIFYNNSKEFLDKIQRILQTNKKYIVKRNKLNLNESYELRYCHEECRILLPLIKLTIKEKKRKLALDILNTIKAGHNQYHIPSGYKEKMLNFARRMDSI